MGIVTVGSSYAPTKVLLIVVVETDEGNNGSSRKPISLESNIG
jgi:hypothetical protein